VNEWLRTCLPLLPKSLKVINFSLYNCYTDKSHLSSRIEEEIRSVIPGLILVDCSPLEASDFGDDILGSASD
jgi:hypothetical protein